MQHHSVPTRLLDWTGSALVALYFSLRDRGGSEDPYKKNDAAVYVLDPWWLNQYTFRRIKKFKDYSGIALVDWEIADYYLNEDEFLRPHRKANLPLAIASIHASHRIAVELLPKVVDWVRE